MKIKICGLRHSDNIEALLPLKPDYLGFIFYEKSRRFAGKVLHPESVRSVTAKKTGVFVNENAVNVMATVKKFGLQAIQLHGEESPGYCRDLISDRLEVIKVFSVDEDFDFDTTKAYEPVCDLFLFDTKGPQRGGNGIPFDWELLGGYGGEKPFFLSGGIGPDDAEKINGLRLPRLYGIDINSRFESEPGRKDTGRVGRFLEALHT